jgi:hypothetical protein
MLLDILFGVITTLATLLWVDRVFPGDLLTTDGLHTVTKIGYAFIVITLVVAVTGWGQ